MRYLLIICLVIGKVFASTNILFLSDIHFSPYLQCSAASCVTLGKLIESDIIYWPKILKNDNSIQYKIETSNKLLTDGLTQSSLFAKQSNVQNIFITGDILTHNFDSLFMKYAPTKLQNQQELTKFSLKTSAYVLAQVESANKKANIFYVVGNNDGDNADYVIPSTGFLESMSLIMRQYLPIPNTVTQSFVKGGYYAAMLNKETMIIGLNSNLLSAINPNKDKALTQLQWLDNILAKAKEHKQHVILLQHIPYGIDMYKTARTSLPTPIIVPVTSAILQQAYLKILDKYADVISGIYAGHYHADYLALLQPSNIPVVGTLALNSNFGNNPGFKILNLDTNGNLANYNAYICNLNHNTILCENGYQSSTLYGMNITKGIGSISSDVGESRTINYRKFYNGNNSLFPQPISDTQHWQYYFCAINNVTMDSYSNCLAKFKPEN